jgi:hypothetical protein
MHNYLNEKQKDALSSFFINIAVGWFSAAFIVVYISKDVTWLILLKFIGNMIGDLYIALWLLKEKKYD